MESLKDLLINVSYPETAQNTNWRHKKLDTLVESAYAYAWLSVSTTIPNKVYEDFIELPDSVDSTIQIFWMV